MQSVLDPPLLADVSERVRRAEEELAEGTESPELERPKRVVIRTPRPLSADIRKRLGLPALKVTPYRFGYVAMLVALIGVPMLLIGWFKATLALVLVALGVLPAVRWFEKREVELRDRVYTHGKEIVGRVLDVEPGGPDRNGKVIRVEFQIATTRVAASVFGSPLARKGLEPGDDVVVYYAPEEPQRCLVVERIARKGSGKARKPVPVPEGGGCGGGGCGGGGCGGGGGGCGGGGCGGGGGGGGGGCGGGCGC